MDTTAWYWLVSIWLLAVGGSVGSFMNVVVHRLPRGMSLVRPGSQCPSCHHAVRWYDNIPVISWFVLQGRCRDCRTPFSIRYAAVEALVAGLFLLLGHLEGLLGGVNLPLASSATPQDAPLLGSYQSWGVCAYHLTLLCSLICAALIQWDRSKPPFPLLLFAWTVGLAGSIVSPQLHPYLNRPAALGFAFHPTPFAGLGVSLLGACVGVGLAGIAYAAGRKQADRIDGWDVGFCGAVGSYLGAAAVACIVPLVAIASIICQRFAGRRLWIGCLTDMTILWILAWRLTDNSLPILGHAASWPTFALSTLWVAIISWTARIR